MAEVGSAGAAGPESARARSTRFALCWLLLLAQVLIPSSYYLWRSDPEEERFAWRMFSARRFRSCKVQAFDVLAGQERAVALNAALHASWIGALRRGRERVVERFLEARCVQPGVAGSTLVRSCREVDGRVLPVQRFHYACDARRLAREPAGRLP
jgi:hypothetical protein